MGIKLTADERRQLRSGGVSISLLPGTEREVATYHNPETGQEFENLPADPWSYEHYTRIRRLRVGPAPAELKAKWEAGTTGRLETYEQRLEDHKRKQEQITQDNELFDDQNNDIAELRQELKELKERLGMTTVEAKVEEGQTRQLKLL